MSGLFSKFTSGLSSPGKHAAVVIPNDSTDLATFARALFIGTGGAIKVDTVGGETITMVVTTGLLPLRVKRVYATGTAALDITAIW